MSKKLEMFQCDICGHTYSTEYFAKECEFKHERNVFANYMLKQGYTLGMIQSLTGAMYGLPDELKNAKKDTMFKIEYLQCNRDYVYRIDVIEDDSIFVINTQDFYRTNVSYDDLVRGLEKKDE